MDTSEPERDTHTISRRQALKKGAMIGGTVLWVAPLVQTIGMSGASAQTTSGTAGRQGASGAGPAANSAGTTGGGTLAVTGMNAQHAAELGLAAAAVGVALTAASRTKKDHRDQLADGADELG